MSADEVFRPGMRVESALQEFRDHISHLETLSSTEKRTMRKLLLRLQPLLADPITADQAQAFEDALHGRYGIEDLIKWLRSPPMPWSHFLPISENKNKQNTTRHGKDGNGTNRWHKNFSGDDLNNLSSVRPVARALSSESLMATRLWKQKKLPDAELLS